MRRVSFMRTSAVLIAWVMMIVLETSNAFSPPSSVSVCFSTRSAWRTRINPTIRNNANAVLSPFVSSSNVAALSKVSHIVLHGQKQPSLQRTTITTTQSWRRHLEVILYHVPKYVERRIRTIRRFLLVMVTSLLVLCHGTSLEAHAAAAGGRRLPHFFVGKQETATTTTSTESRNRLFGRRFRRRSKDHTTQVISTKQKKQKNQHQQQQQSKETSIKKNQKQSSTYLISMVSGTTLATTVGIVVAKNVRKSREKKDGTMELDNEFTTTADDDDANVPSLAEALDALERAKARESVERVLDRVEEERKKAEAKRKEAAVHKTKQDNILSSSQSMHTSTTENTPLLDMEEEEDEEEDEEEEDIKDSKEAGTDADYKTKSKVEVNHASVIEEDDLKKSTVLATPTKGSNRDKQDFPSLPTQSPSKESIITDTPNKNTKRPKPKAVQVRVSGKSKSKSPKTPPTPKNVDNKSKMISAKKSEKIARDLLKARLAIEAKNRSKREKIVRLSSTDVKRASVVNEEDLVGAIASSTTKDILSQLDKEGVEGNDRTSRSAQKKAEATARALLQTRLAIEAREKIKSSIQCVSRREDSPATSSKKAEATARALLEARLRQQSKASTGSHPNGVDPDGMSRKVTSDKKAEATARALLTTRLAMETKQRTMERSTSASSESNDALARKPSDEIVLSDIVSEVQARKMLGLASEATERKILDNKIEAKKVAEGKQRALLARRLQMEKREKLKKFVTNGNDTQSQPKEDETTIAARYASMDLETRAFNILLDLGMIERTPDPNYEDDSSS